MVKYPKEIIMVDIDKLKPYEKNNQLHTAEHIKKLAEIIQRNGFNNPIQINAKYEIGAGHARYYAAKYLKLKEVPCIMLDIDDEAWRANRIADNKLAKDSKWNLANLHFELSDMKEKGFDISLTGFEDKEISDLFSEHKIKKENINPYKKLYWLIISDPENILKIQKIIDQLQKIDGVEIETTAN